MAELLEFPLLRVPFEALRRAAKDRKSVCDDVCDKVTLLLQSSGTSHTREEHLLSLSQVLGSLTGLKRKLHEVSGSEAGDAQRCASRLQHLQSIGLPPKDGAVQWNKLRLDRLLAEHLLRSGLHDTAAQLVGSGGILDLVDSHIFVAARCVTRALAAHDCSLALSWCEENRARLKKLKSKLEFKLRVQEFVELVRTDQRRCGHLQHAVAALVFGPRTTCPAYRPLFDDAAWASLHDTFRSDLARVHSLSPHSSLETLLQSGLVALKTPLSYAEGCSREDPLHLGEFRTLAAGLPSAKHVRSKLVCSATRQVMGDDNPPMVLPNGYVYSARAIELNLAANEGRVVCPCTGAACAAHELRRAYVV
ncbi:MAG: hypothetical protein WDW38_000674 [Sanguina aurantia]